MSDPQLWHDTLAAFASGDDDLLVVVQCRTDRFTGDASVETMRFERALARLCVRADRAFTVLRLVPGDLTTVGARAPSAAAVARHGAWLEAIATWRRFADARVSLTTQRSLRPVPWPDAVWSGRRDASTALPAPAAEVVAAIEAGAGMTPLTSADHGLDADPADLHPSLLL